jgi:hypothetical protein
MPSAKTSRQSLFTTRKELGSDRPSEGMERDFRLYGLLGPWFDKSWRSGESDMRTVIQSLTLIAHDDTLVGSGPI